MHDPRTNIRCARIIANGVRACGSMVALARRTGVLRTSLIYWRTNGAPAYRRADVNKVIWAAKKQKEAA